MEPLRGGGLVNLSKKALDKLKEKLPDETPASFGLRWAAGRENVLTVFSGMSNLEQVKANIETFVDSKSLIEKEDLLGPELSKIFQSPG